MMLKYLEKRYKSFSSALSKLEELTKTPVKSLTPKKKREIAHYRKLTKTQTQWSQHFDSIQEHLSSHVLINGVSQELPPAICALKADAKRDWVLYKSENVKEENEFE